jgi:hypothetical protein
MRWTAGVLGGIEEHLAATAAPAGAEPVVHAGREHARQGFTAKEAGRNRVVPFDPQLRLDRQERVRLGLRSYGP